MPKIDCIAPCLWFESQAEEAAEFYVSMFPDSQITHVLRSSVDTPGANAGSVILVDFTLVGQSCQALNGGPNQPFNERISMSVQCVDQLEVDRLWGSFVGAGGQPVQCGWLRDRFGVPWQIVPVELMQMMRDLDAAKSRRVMEAMMQMVKFDLAELRKVYEGN